MRWREGVTRQGEKDRWEVVVVGGEQAVEARRRRVRGCQSATMMAQGEEVGERM